MVYLVRSSDKARGTKQCFVYNKPMFFKILELINQDGNYVKLFCCRRRRLYPVPPYISACAYLANHFSHRTREQPIKLIYGYISISFMESLRIFQENMLIFDLKNDSLSSRIR